MLEDAAPCPHGCECRLEAAAILSALVAPALLDEASEPAPASARRMRHDRPRPGVQARVPLVVPWVDVWEVPVATAALDVERGDQAVLRLAVRQRISDKAQS